MSRYRASHASVQLFVTALTAGLVLGCGLSPLEASDRDGSTAGAAATGMDPNRLARIQRSLQRYIDAEQLAGAVTIVARRGRVAHFLALGRRDAERPMTRDTLFRIYSMTKPIVSVAVLMLYEDGALLLTDPISKYLPELGDLPVMKNAEGPVGDVEPAQRDMTIRDLLTHTSGLASGFPAAGSAGAIGAAYLDAGIRDTRTSLTPEQWTTALASQPLLFQPGTRFNYGVSTDVLGVLIAKVSGRPLEAFLAERIFEPLGMLDTSFSVPDERLDRFAANYITAPDGRIALLDDPLTSRFRKPPVFPSGAGGLVSTAEDYLRFAEMLRREGEAPGGRLLSRKTVELMRINHLTDAQRDVPFLKGWFAGQGFGLGVSVVEDIAPGQVLGSVGQYGWGGAAGTFFWVDPAEELVAVLMIQQMTPEAIPVIADWKTLVYQAIDD